MKTQRSTHISSLFSPGRSRGYRQLMLLLALLLGGGLLSIGVYETQATPEPVKLIIDTDMGVDDAAAIGWLLSQPKYEADVVGITTVGGNTTMENSTNNVLTILDVAGRTDIPVIMGAAAPLSQTLSATGAFVHGPDGLWFLGWANPHDLSNLPTDAPAFLCQNAAADTKLVTLGPLTNIALAIAACPDQMALYDEIIILGGVNTARGNISPEAEFNFWIDPEAADQVLKAGLMPRLIPLDTFDTFAITPDDVQTLFTDGNPMGQFLANALQIYMDVQIQQAGRNDAAVPDVTAVMIALDEQLFIKGEQTALVKMVPGIVGEPNPERLVRGKSIIGLAFSEKVPMIADDYELSLLAQRAFTEPDFDLEAELALILMREPDNIHYVNDVREHTMRRLFMRFLTN